MADFPKNTNAQIVIIETDGREGAHFNTNMSFLPRVGDNIELTSYVDMRAKLPYLHSLTVDRVDHKMGDIVGDEEGHYIAQIFARRRD
jgi:hypothetical protein